VETSRNFVTGPAGPPEQHGTAVAGIIAAVADNHIGIAGVAPHARLMALRACWQQAPGKSPPTVCDSLSLAKALDFAWDTMMSLLFLGAKGHRITAGDLREMATEYDCLNPETSRSVLAFYQSRKGNALVTRGKAREPKVQAH